MGSGSEQAGRGDGGAAEEHTDSSCRAGAIRQSGLKKFKQEEAKTSDGEIHTPSKAAAKGADEKVSSALKVLKCSMDMGFFRYL